MAIATPPRQLTRVAPSIQLFDSLNPVEVGNPDRAQIGEYFEMLQKSPVVRAGAKAKVLATVSLFDDYKHGDADIQAFVRQNFEQMEGSFAEAIARFSIFSAIGNAVIPLELKQDGTDFVLDRLITLDPRYYSFVGQDGDITLVRFQGRTAKKDIDYERCLHLVHDRFLTPDNSPWGVAECKTALAAWKAWKAVMGQGLTAAQAQATPNLDVQRDPEPVQILGADGQPIEGEAKLSTQVIEESLETLRNGGVFIHDAKTIAKVLEADTDGSFFQWFLEMLERLQLLAFLVPETTFSVGKGGLGNVTLSEQHSDIFIRNVRQRANQIKQSLIEKVVCPIVDFKFGRQDNYGSFPEPEIEAQDNAQLMQAIASAVSQGAFAPQQLEAIWERMGELAGLPDFETLIDTSANLPPFGDEEVDAV